jgi:hypothetical protein
VSTPVCSLTKERVVVGRVDLFSVKESNNEHDAVLSSQRGLACFYERLPPARIDCGSGGMNGVETLYDNQSRRLRRGYESALARAKGAKFCHSPTEFPARS